MARSPTERRDDLWSAAAGALVEGPWRCSSPAAPSLWARPEAVLAAGSQGPYLYRTQVTAPRVRVVADLRQSAAPAGPGERQCAPRPATVRLLRPFAEVRPREVVTALLLTLNVFLLLTAYYLLKVAREPLILLGGGAEVKSYAGAGQALLLVVMVRAYDALARRLERMRLIGSVLLFFTLNLVAFWALGTSGVPLGVPFFLWVGIFNVTVVAQFWSFANDIYTPEQGGRLFAILGIGSSIGAVVGARIAGQLIGHLGPYGLMPLAGVLLLVCLGLFYVVHRRERRGVHRREAATQQAAPAVRDDVRIAVQGGPKLVFKSRYLLLVALLILLINWVNTTGEYVLDRTLLAGAVEDASARGMSVAHYVGAFKASFFGWVNLFGVLLQLFAVSRVVRYLGVPHSLLVLPLLSLTGYGVMAFAPLLPLIFVAKVAENSLDYSLQNTVRYALFLVTTREAKYTAKTFIDTFVVRFGDVLAAACVWVGSVLAVGTRSFALFNVLLVLGWLVVAVAIGRRYPAPPRASERRPRAPGLRPLAEAKA
jgi:ATP:ADP antiporter, AAA family